jgi:CDP-glucose 4,6-dehydratase
VGLEARGRGSVLVSRVLVTGGHGFVASHLVAALLARGEAVRVLDRPEPRLADVGGPRRSGLDLLGIRGEVELAEGDLRDAGAVERAVAGCDSAFHLAAQTIVGVARESPRETLEVNVAGAWNVFEACREHGVARVVFASSDKAYGSSPELPYREDFPLRAEYPYDASKAAADIVARSYAHAYGLPVAVSRFANVYGGGDLNFTRLIPETAVAVLEGRPPRIRSDGSPERDFLHVDDAVSAYLVIADILGAGGAAGEAFNAGGERPHSVREVIELIVELTGAEVEPDFQGTGNPDGEIDRQFVDSTKLRDLTGWRPTVDLREGLRRTLDWYREHPEIRPAPKEAVAK